MSSLYFYKEVSSMNKSYFVLGIIFLLIFEVNITTINLKGKKSPKFNKEQKEQKMQTSKLNDKTFNSLSY